jgi:hypothetical protein
LQLDLDAGLTHFTRLRIELKNAKADETGSGRRTLHGTDFLAQEASTGIATKSIFQLTEDGE